MCSEKDEKFVIITIDGPAGAGKSTVAKKVAHTLGYEYLDTGALYRAIALYLRDKKVPPVESDEMRAALSSVDIYFEKERIYLDGRDVSKEIRTVEIEAIVSSYAKLRLVRDKLMEIQRKIGSLGNIVADGRDMGTVVFPEAVLKIYLNAELKERAKRRWNDIKSSGRELSLEEVEIQLKKRDEEDSKRKHSPLRVPDGAFVIDSTDLTADQIVKRVVELAEKVIKSKGDGR